jgi:hypothetical protein
MINYEENSIKTPYDHMPSLSISRELIPVDKSVLEKSGKSGSGRKDSARQDVALEIKGMVFPYI